VDIQGIAQQVQGHPDSADIQDTQDTQGQQVGLEPQEQVGFQDTLGIADFQGIAAFVACPVILDSADCRATPDTAG